MIRMLIVRRKGWIPCEAGLSEVVAAELRRKEGKPTFVNLELLACEAGVDDDEMLM